MSAKQIEQTETTETTAPEPTVVSDLASDGNTSTQPADSSSTNNRHGHDQDQSWDRASSDDPRPREQGSPVAYSGSTYGQLDIEQNGLSTGAHLAKDGRINIKIVQHSKKLSNLLLPSLCKHVEWQQKDQEHKQKQKQKQDQAHDTAKPFIPPGLGDSDADDGLPPPPMNIVIQIVGSRGDVQPFVALGQVLKTKFKHRVRIATHPTFRSFVTDNGLEFFSIGGDPAELMAFMVKNPGLMPGMDSLRNGDIGKHRKSIYEMTTGCWRSCIEPGDGTGVPVSDYYVDGHSFDTAISSSDPAQKPFIADVIIANPPSFAHVHIAEKMGIPLHLMFTMPWSPTQAFPHPLANIVSSNTDSSMANFLSYALVDMLTWQGLGDVINRFRERSLGLGPVNIISAPGMISRLRIPWTYCWSPALIPKPLDWGSNIDISGFYFLNLATNYTPPPELKEFLQAGPPPVYIGFGSIVVDDPNAMTRMVFEAVKKTGQRALVSKGWGGLGADEVGIPDGVYMLGNCPHDWLFQYVSCVVHHGGAGTTAAGISAGRPTVIVPFFGDQPFWGAMCARAGAGPEPIPYKNMTADKLANQILEALKPESVAQARELSNRIKQENGTESGADSFHKQIGLSDLRCSLCPDRVAVWRVRHSNIRLSAFAASVLAAEDLISTTDVKLYRPREYEIESGPWGPISGGASALLGTLASIGMGVADFPVEVLKSLKIASHDIKEAQEKHRTGSQSAAGSGTSTPVPASPNRQTTSSETSSLSDIHSTTTGRATAAAAASSSGNNNNNNNNTASQQTSPRSSMSTVLSPDGTPRQGQQQQQEQRRGSSSKSSSLSRPHSPCRYGGEEKTVCAEEVAHLTIESTINSAKAAGKIASAGLKSPMDFTLSLAQGFHNAPKLYGDTTVRKTEKITGFQSGLRVAGKELGYGLYDGITGLVTQPVEGARKEGTAGLFKGAAKGIGGLILKPSAGFWGIPGYTAKGIYMELKNRFGSSVQNYVIAARTVQGYEEWKWARPEEKAKVVAAWKSSKVETKKGGKKYGTELEQEMESRILTRTPSNNVKLVQGFKNTRHLTWDERKELAARRDELRRQEREEKRKKRLEAEAAQAAQAVQSDTSRIQDGKTPDMDTLSSTSTIVGAAALDEDEIIERALQDSINKMPTFGRDEEAYKKAIHEGIREARRRLAEERERRQRRQQKNKSEALPTEEDDRQKEDELDEDEQDNDEELHLALRLSLMEHQKQQEQEERHWKQNQRQKQGPDIPDDPDDYNDVHVNVNVNDTNDSSSEIGSDEDADFKRAIEESKRLHTERQEFERLVADLAWTERKKESLKEQQ